MSPYKRGDIAKVKLIDAYDEERRKRKVHHCSICKGLDPSYKTLLENNRSSGGFSWLSVYTKYGRDRLGVM